MKLKIETINEMLSEENHIHLMFWLLWILLLICTIAFYFIAFVEWQYTSELLRFTIWVIVINIFIFIRIE
jgi:hypothetical protein